MKKLEHITVLRMIMFGDKSKLLLCLLLFFNLFSGLEALPEEHKSKFGDYVDHSSIYSKRPINLINKQILERFNDTKPIPIYSYNKGFKNPENDLSPIKNVTLDSKDSYLLFKPIKEINNDAKTVKTSTITSNTSSKIDYDYKNIDTYVITIRINNKIAQDLEAILWPDGTISLPVKSLADILEIPYEQNHVNNNISFLQPVSNSNINVDVENSTIMTGNNLVEVKKPKIVLIKQGFLVQDEVFVPEEVLQNIFDIKTSYTKSNYVMDLTTGKVLKAFLEINEGGQSKQPLVQEEPFSTVDTAEKENKKFKIKRIDYSVGSTYNQSSDQLSSNNTGTASLSISSKGNLLGGEYNIGASSYYGQNGLVIGSYRASLDYIKPKYELSLGSTTTRLSEIAVSASNIIGIRLGSVGAVDNSSTVPRLIQGSADDNTYVELFINDVYSDKQLVKNGRFDFDSLTYPIGSFVRIRVEQVALDGKRTIVYNKTFSQDRDLLAPGQKQFLIFSGIDSTAITNNFNLFGDQFDTLSTQPLKFISGGKFRMGLTKNLTMGINFAKDFALKQPSRILDDNTNYLLSSQFYRSGSSSTGSIASIDFDFLPTKNLRINAEAAISSAKSKKEPNLDPNGKDWGGFIGVNYNKKSYSLNAKAFSYGSDFYSPGSNNLIDRRGFEVDSRWKLGLFDFYGGITRYNANLDNYFPGGQAEIFNYNLYASTQVEDKSNVIFGVRSSSVSNSNYLDKETTYDITVKHRFSSKADISINYARTIRRSRTSSITDSAKTANDRLNLDFTYDADKWGIIRLSHEMLMLDPVSRFLLGQINQSYYQEGVYSKNIRLSLDRSNLPIKGFTFSPNIGYRYGGENKGLNFGMSLGYNIRPGRQITLNYAYNSSFARYIPGGISFGGNRNHTLSFNFVDSLGFGKEKGVNALGGSSLFIDNSKGIIKGSVFVDLNQNGMKDPDEKGIEGVDVSLQYLYNVTTDKDGNYIAANIPAGARKVGIDKSTLPVIYTPTVADALVNVKPQKVYIANLAVTVSPGSISGIVDIQKKGVAKSDVIVQLLDKNGKEVKYTTTDDEGKYYMEGVSPGEYTIAVDKNYLAYKGVEYDNNDQKYKISIPIIVDDFVDIENIDFTLVPKQSEVKQFK